PTFLLRIPSCTSWVELFEVEMRIQCLFPSRPSSDADTGVKYRSKPTFRNLPSFERISPMATLEAPVRPARTNLHAGPFVTEPFFDFRNEENARRMRAAIAKVRSQLGREYDLIIGGKRIKTSEKIKSLNPSKPYEIVGTHQNDDKEQVEQSIQAVLTALDSWRHNEL